ncbi:MAG: hypothetical protein V7K41_20245 [Nostoc sp.]|uniref:hypothetical protein n=1 Tax=Nostoc sp. TaxID=1180 RepID=UPI002FF72887
MIPPQVSHSAYGLDKLTGFIKAIANYAQYSLAQGEQRLVEKPKGCPIPKILNILLINRATIENRAAN